MNSRERILEAIDHKTIDRLPTDIWATYEVWEKLKRHFGKKIDIYDSLKIDGMPMISPTYKGPILTTKRIDYWGIRWKKVPYRTGVYEEQENYPLAEAKTIEDLNNYQWPQSDWFDYSEMRKQAKCIRENRVVKCGYMAPFYYHNLLRGFEQSLIDPLENPEFTHELLKRITDTFINLHKKMFEVCDGLIDVAEVTDDLGSQTGPLISLDLYKDFYAPLHKRLIKLCKDFGIKVFHHDDGSNRIFIPTLIELGIDILNPIQWRLPNMAMNELKAEFGKDVCFHGAIDNQYILPFGSEDEVRKEVQRCIDELAIDKTGYILAPCHNIQANTPIENIIAMYDEAQKYGKY